MFWGNHSQMNHLEVWKADYPYPEGSEGNQSCLLDQSRFPKLRRLHLHSPSFDTMDEISRHKEFPSLQELCMHAPGPHWMDFVRPCVSTLVKLSLRFEEDLDGRGGNFVEEILLPRLTHLSCIFSSQADSTHWQIPTFVTPALEHYLQEHSFKRDLIHKDVSKVNTLIIKGACNVDWNLFPSLITLELHEETSEVKTTCKGLAADPGLCPHFQSLVVYRPRHETGDNNPWPDFFETRTRITQKKILCELDVQKYRIDPVSLR